MDAKKLFSFMNQLTHVPIAQKFKQAPSKTLYNAVYPVNQTTNCSTPKIDFSDSNSTSEDSDLEIEKIGFKKFEVQQHEPEDDFSYLKTNYIVDSLAYLQTK